jgi:glutamine synthetase
LDLFSEMGIKKHWSWGHMKLEEYTKKIQIEGRVLGDISKNHVLQLFVTKIL